MEETLTLKRKPVITMEDLSPEVIQEILSRLPIKSLLGSRCVCSTWRNLVNEPRFANMHFSQVSQNQNPGLILQTLKSELYVIPDCDTCDVAIRLCNLPFESCLPVFKLIGSCNGFLCLADVNRYYRSIIIYNPVTREYMKVPENPSFGNVNSIFFGFGFDPERKEYKVVRTRNSSHMSLEIEVHTLGTDSWRTIGQHNTGGYMGRPGVLADGHLHWWSVHGSFRVESIISINVRDEKIRLIQPPLSIVGKSQCNLHFGSLGGRLCMVDETFRRRAEVWVMKDYGMVESWTKEFVIQSGSFGRSIQILGIQKDGKILVECANKGLFTYDHRSSRLKDLRIPGLPNFFVTLPYVASLVSFKEAFVSEKP